MAEKVSAALSHIGCAHFSHKHQETQLPTEVGGNEGERTENGNRVEGTSGSDISGSVAFSITLTY